MAEETKNKPSYERNAYGRMKPAWTIMQDVVAGTLRLRDCDSIQHANYLPAEPAEKVDHYVYRKSRAIFFNATDRTVNGLVGMVFRKEPKLGDDVPEVIRGVEKTEETEKKEGHWENIDLAGAHGSVFCKEVFTDAVRDGHAAILVDMPPQLPEGSTEADAKGRRPYWVSYQADQIINWRTRVVNGKTQLDLIVFKEVSQEPDGDYGEKTVTRFRVLRPGSWELWRQIQGMNGGLDVVFEDGGEVSLPVIPVAIVYSRRTAFLESQPPLLDLALTNIAHYQKYNDFSLYVHICSRPILCRKPTSDKPIQTISAYSVMETSAEGDIWFAETTGAALEAASNDIKDLETRMAVMGLAIVEGKSKPQPETTATEEVLDHVREESDLATAARSLKDAMELSLQFHAQYLTPSATTGGSVELGATIEELTLSPEEIQAYSNMVAARPPQISLETMWAILGRAGKLPADFDAEEEKRRIEAAEKKQQEMEIAKQEQLDRSFMRGGAAE